jgi:hypothetical protein
MEIDDPKSCEEIVQVIRKKVTHWTERPGVLRDVDGIKLILECL